MSLYFTLSFVSCNFNYFEKHSVWKFMYKWVTDTPLDPVDRSALDPWTPSTEFADLYTWHQFRGVFVHKNNEKCLCKHGSLGSVFELWPARSPDLNPLDSYLCCHLKSIVYTTAVNGVTQLQQRVEDGCELIRNTPVISERVRQSLMRRAAP
jgi:hypothetical protein